MFSIGSLYIVKTWDRDGSRERMRLRSALTMAEKASPDGVGLTRVDQHVSR